MIQSNFQGCSDELTRLVGVPYSFRSADATGLDCWQLTCAVRKSVFGIATPSYFYPDDETLCGQMLLTVALREWESVETAAAEPGDVLILRLGVMPVHCGVVLGNHKFIHTLRGRNSCVEDYTATAWRSRVFGVFRWR